MPILFIADLHLSPHNTQLTQAFYDYLEYRAKNAKALYILGDFFDFYLGDDAINDFEKQIAQALAKYSKNGTAVYLMHGNRDFLVGEKFAAMANAKLLTDPTLIDLDEVPVLLMHGDSLCTDDQAYMQMRNKVRNPAWQAEILAQPIAQRLALAQQLRAHSMQANSEKTLAIMDVNFEAVKNTMQKFQVENLIHGHTHRPDVHEFSIDNHVARRYVTGDWRINQDLTQDSGWEIRYDGLTLTLLEFSLTELPYH